MTYSIDHNRIQQFGSLEFLARQVVEGFIVGLHKSPFHGFSVEFAEHRLYNSGESTRHIDWKLYGRTDRMYVKRFEEETNLRCQIVIDHSSSMYFPVKGKPTIDDPDKITFAIYAAAVVMNLLRRQRDAVGLTVFSDQIEWTSMARSSSVHYKYIYSQLEKLLVPLPAEARKQTSAVQTLHTVADSIHKRSLVVIFSDMFEPGNDTPAFFSALQHLRHNKHEVILFHVVDRKTELDFEYDNRPHRFIDMETGQQIKVNPGEVREGYVNALRNFKEELKLRCAQYRIDFVEADIGKGFTQVLQPYLIKREKLY